MCAWSITHWCMYKAIPLVFYFGIFSVHWLNSTIRMVQRFEMNELIKSVPLFIIKTCHTLKLSSNKIVLFKKMLCFKYSLFATCTKEYDYTHHKYFTIFFYVQWPMCIHLSNHFSTLFQNKTVCPKSSTIFFVYRNTYHMEQFIKFEHLFLWECLHEPTIHKISPQVNCCHYKIFMYWEGYHVQYSKKEVIF